MCVCYCIKAYHALDDLSKCNMFAVQPPGLVEQYEELGTIGVLAVIGHRNDAGGTVTQDKVLIHEFVSVNALT